MDTPAAERSRPAPAPLVPNAGSMPELRVGRYRLDPRWKGALASRQARWIGLSAGTLALNTALGPLLNPALVLALALGLGAWAAWPSRWLMGPALTLAAVGVAALIGLLMAHREAPLLLSGAQVIGAGAVVGLGLGPLAGGALDAWRRAQSVLGGAAGAGLGWWAAIALVGPAGDSVLLAALQGATLGLVASQSVVAAAMQWTASDRIPSPGRIRGSLAPPYREPCMRASALDQGFERQAPDPETRDGLGEVAAWVYRLQWTLMSLDRELDGLQPEQLQERRMELTERALATEDEFTRDRLLATSRHLEQLLKHREALALERGRTAALSEYASAYLEEARAGLALARVQPGDHVPERLSDVLGRLRGHAAAGEAQRRTAREVGAVV